MQLMVKPFSCFGGFCIDGKWAKCPNVNWIGNWVSRHLQPIDARFVKESMYNVQRMGNAIWFRW